MTKSYLSSVGISLKNTFQSFSCFHSLSLNLPSKQGSVLSFNVLWNDIVRSVVLHSCLWEPEKFSKLYKNGMDCSCAGFGVGLLSVHWCIGFSQDLQRRWIARSSTLWTEIEFVLIWYIAIIYCSSVDLIPLSSHKITILKNNRS